MSLAEEAQQSSCCSDELKALLREWVEKRQDAVASKVLADKIKPLVAACDCDICKRMTGNLIQREYPMFSRGIRKKSDKIWLSSVLTLSLHDKMIVVQWKKGSHTSFVFFLLCNCTLLNIYALVSQVICAKMVDAVMYGFETKIVQLDIITSSVISLESWAWVGSPSNKSSH